MTETATAVATNASALSTEDAMRRALELAARGPVTGGNPQVGCVLLAADGSVVAEGWHHGAGTAHAEVDALSQLPTINGLPDARGFTAIVTLEPCNHTGRTGPCSEALIAAGISRVVYAIADPGATSGGGSERLRQAGVEVEGGMLADDASDFLRVWLTASRLGRPFVTAKWASSLDGRAAASDGSSQWITGPEARALVHQLRSENDAILVGTGTVLEDDPSLTARSRRGDLLAHQPVPVVIGERAIPANATLREHPAGLIETGTRDLDTVLSDLFDRGIRRAFVEGGPQLASAFVEAGLVDEFQIFLAPMLIGGSKTALGDIGVATINDAVDLTIVSTTTVGDDLLVVARPVRKA
jgi:diaminohydroxyphosphoribosylaminopyrimidine deaminase/5-amino-6-(5-phosphoribosylamino)uracil reductase